MGNLYMETWGEGPPVVLVHGSLELLAAAVRLVPVFRRGRPIWETDLPLAELASTRYPKLVISGGHRAGFDAICDELAGWIGASRTVVAGARHEIQFAGQPLNEVLLTLWRTTSTGMFK
jgi:hypothetical protein